MPHDIEFIYVLSMFIYTSMFDMLPTVSRCHHTGDRISGKQLCLDLLLKLDSSHRDQMGPDVEKFQDFCASAMSHLLFS